MAEHLVITQGPTGKKLVRAELDNFQVNAIIPDVTCDTSVYTGAVVRMQTNGTAVNALADSIENSNIIGIVEGKPDATHCHIRVANVTEGLFSGLDVTKECYLSATTPGGVVQTVPMASGNVKLKIGQPFSDKAILIMKGDRTVRA